MVNSSRLEDRFAKELELRGYDFERQVKIGTYFVDFLLSDRTVIEVDGRHHLMKDRIYHDRKRDRFLEESGYKVVHLPAKSCMSFFKRGPPKKRVLREL